MQGMKRVYFMSEKNKVTFLPIKNKTNPASFFKKVARNITLSSSTPIVKCQGNFNIPASTLQDPLNRVLSFVRVYYRAPRR